MISYFKSNTSQHRYFLNPDKENECLVIQRIGVIERVKNRKAWGGFVKYNVCCECNLLTTSEITKIYCYHSTTYCHDALVLTRC